MKKRSTLLWSVFILSFLTLLAAAPQIEAQSGQPEDERSVMVGRVSHVEGKLLRYVPDEQDWVAVVKDAPFGFYDALYSEEAGRAELIMPNETWVRVGGDTQIQLITLEEGVTEVDVASGTARFYNKGQAGIIKATTPFGYVSAPPNTSFDLYVGNESVEVLALSGRVDFVQADSNTRYEVSAGSSALLADSRQVTLSDSYVDADWDNWNRQRDQLWSNRTRVAGDSVEYLPSQLQHDAYALEENGRWDRVQYEGEYRYFWRPTRVAAGWAPYTMGRWTMWYGDNCWIPAEPFGYLTHHYGSWVSVGGLWYWAPPVARAAVRIGPPRPLLPIPFAWYPGRVAWVYSGVRIGWIPLAPFEPFYARRMWGPRVVVVRDIARINIHPRNFRYVDHAVIINQNNFYRVNTYRNVLLRNINNVTIINNFRAAPIVNDLVIRDINRIPQRFNFTNVRVERKPHRTTIDRIQRNQAIAQRNVNVTAQSVRRNVNQVKLSTPAKGVRIAEPKVRAKLVPANQVNKPVNQVNFRERQLKSKPKQVGAPGPPTQRREPGKPPVGKPPAPSYQPAPGPSSRPQGPAGKQVQPVPKREQAKPPAGKQAGKPAAPSDQPATYQGGKPQKAIRTQAEPAARPQAKQPGAGKQIGKPSGPSQQTASPPSGRQADPSQKAQKPARGQQVQPASQGRKAPTAATQPGQAKQTGPKKTKSQKELDAEIRAGKGQGGLQAPPWQSPPR